MQRLLIPCASLGLGTVLAYYLADYIYQYSALITGIVIFAAIAVVTQANKFHKGQMVLLASINLVGFTILSVVITGMPTSPAEIGLFQGITMATVIAMTFLEFVRDRGVWNVYFYRNVAIVAVIILTGLSLSFSGLLENQGSGMLAVNQFAYMSASVLQLMVFGIALSLLMSYRMTQKQPSDPWVTLSVISLCLCTMGLWLFELPLVLFTIVFSTLFLSMINSSHTVAYTDNLTGVPGRAAMEEAYKALPRNFTLAMVDIDHFKNFNDMYGHEVGDDVLSMVAKKLAAVTGGGEVFRWGGEEFAIIFRNKSTSTTIKHLEAVRNSVANYQMRIRNLQSRPKTVTQGRSRRGALDQFEQKVSVNVSIGVADTTHGTRDPTAILALADKALYQAKQAGRNTVIAYSGAR